MQSGDTITAVSSAVGPAARMIVRLSGPSSRSLAATLCPGARLAASAAEPARLRLRGFTVPVTLYAFHAPKSYTGEDLVEFHVPGSPPLARLLLDDLLAKGARLADAGEFTARAYFNGRMGLTEAEGVAATIAAHGEGELRAARQLLSGELARRLRPAMELVAETLALVEVGIDFAEEDVTFLPAAELKDRIARADGMLREVVEGSGRFDRLTHEPRVVLVGRPNAGKSTLLNALAGRERAVVSPVAGTTRDAISAEVALKRGIVRLIDVAGIDDGSKSPAPAMSVARQMRDRALRELETADLVVRVHDGSDSSPPPTLPRPPDLIVLTKRDRVTGGPPVAFPDDRTTPITSVSAHTGENMDTLLAVLDDLAFGPGPAGASLTLNARHVHALSDARAALTRAAGLVSAGGELVALELRETLDALGQILGDVSPDDLLGRIFSAFCIGK